MKNLVLKCLCIILPLHIAAHAISSIDDVIQQYDQECFSKGNDDDNLDELAKSGGITHLDEEPSGIVNNSVNVISGVYTDFETDITALSPEPLHMQRFYLSSDRSLGTLGKGWNSNNFVLMQVRDNVVAYLMDAGGSFYTYVLDQDYQFKLAMSSFQRGVTNSSTGKISGWTNIKNNRVYFNKKNEKYYMVRSTGSNLKFEKCHKNGIWRLQTESLPNVT